MAKIHQPKYSKSEVSQRFNLKELLGYTPTDKQKELFFELVVNYQQERTTSGKDIDGRSFTPYSKNYANKKGVTRNSVDLLDTGSMLSSFEESQVQKNVVKIKMKEGEETLKSYNHNVGDTLPRRTFFGIKEEREIKSILDEVDSIKQGERNTQEPRQTQPQEETIDLAELRSLILQSDISFEDF